MRNNRCHGQLSTLRSDTLEWSYRDNVATSLRTDSLANGDIVNNEERSEKKLQNLKVFLLYCVNVCESYRMPVTGE